MNLDELKAEFDRMEREAFRLQQHQSYAGVKGPEWEAWQAANHCRRSLPRPIPEESRGLHGCRAAGVRRAHRRVAR